MITFDGEYTVMVHFELTEEDALESGGVNLFQVKSSIKEIPDWILDGVTDVIDLRDNDTITVLPVEGIVKKDDKVVNMEEVPDIENKNSEEK